MKVKRAILLFLTSVSAGFVNGLLGTGGGMIILPSLVGFGMDRKKAHANSVCIIFFICLVSAFIYFQSNNLVFATSLPYIPWGIAGAIAGSALLPKINQNILKKLFACFSIWAAYRLITKWTII